MDLTAPRRIGWAQQGRPEWREGINPAARKRDKDWSLPSPPPLDRRAQNPEIYPVFRGTFRGILVPEHVMRSSSMSPWSHSRPRLHLAGVPSGIGSQREWPR